MQHLSLKGADLLSAARGAPELRLESGGTEGSSPNSDQ